jgi:dTDP-D-glucose 4,6-dehydratase
MNAKQHIYMSSEKIRKELGYKEIVSFEDGMERTINWILNNMPNLQYANEYAIEDKIIEKSGDLS